MHRPTPLFIVLLSTLLSLGAGAQSLTPGTLANGPTDLGSCTATGANTYLCDGSTLCTWQMASFAFSCVMNPSPSSTSSATAGAASSSSSTAASGPPGQTGCVAHSGHFDCDGGVFCELVAGAWDCQGGEELSAEGEAASGSTCVVHGGHTHGDCSGQCNGVDLGEYNMNMHILSVFIVLISSCIGVFLPLISSGLMARSFFRNIFFAAKHFGTGVILSTAFIHLLYHAFIMFGNTCLGELHFEPAAAAITMAGVYVVFAVDFFVMRWLKSRAANRLTRDRQAAADGPKDSPSPSSSSSTNEKSLAAFGHSHGPAPESGMDYASPQAHFDVLILEAGIIFHSIMIGVSLGASGGDQWQPLFIAVIFHQLFEGLALGARIGLLIFPAGSLKKWLMGAAFGLITPVGIAIGIGVHAGYNPNSGSALLSIGILDSISAGILIYAGIIEMLHHDFMAGELSTARMHKVFLAFAFLLAGSLCMSVLGKWA